MQVAELAPIPKIVHPSQRDAIMRSIEWCPWPLKCVSTKKPITTADKRGACVCQNHTLWYSVR